MLRLERRRLGTQRSLVDSQVGYTASAGSETPLTLEVRFLFGWPVDRVVLVQGIRLLLCLEGFLALMLPRHRRRDQACRDHPARRTPAAHLTIEDEVGRVAAL